MSLQLHAENWVLNQEEERFRRPPNLLLVTRHFVTRHLSCQQRLKRVGVLGPALYEEPFFRNLEIDSESNQQILSFQLGPSLFLLLSQLLSAFSLFPFALHV